MKHSYEKAMHTQSRGPKAKHDLGQHFLYDEDLLQGLVSSCGITDKDAVLEIGPGPGALTACLCRNAGKVLAIEVDHDILPFLKAATLSFQNLEILEADFRKVPPEVITGHLGDCFSVISNIPYNITTPILDYLFDSCLPILKIALMVQKEVAQKLAAVPGDSEYGLISMRRALIADAEIVQEIPAAMFSPPPKVDSSFIIMNMHREWLDRVFDVALLNKMIKAAFLYRRKTITNALGGVVAPDILITALEQNNLDRRLRGEVLSKEQWISLANTCSTLLT